MTEAERQNSGYVQKRVGRRGLFRGAAAGGAGLALAAAGCSSRGKAAQSSNRSATGQASQQPKKGGTLIYAGGVAGSYDTQGRTFDPHIQTQYAAKGYTLFYERLLSYDLVTYKVGPELAQKWEQPSPTEYLLQLQPGVKWQNKPPVNGRPLTTDDVLWSLQRASTDDPKFFSRSLLASVDKIEAPDQQTIRVTTRGPNASTLTTLSVDNLAILSREVFEKNPKPITAEAAVGTGPFMMTSVEEKVGAEYARNPDYWKPGLPYLDGIKVKAFSEALSAWAAFLAGQVDITVRVPGSEGKKYIAQQGPGFTPAWSADDTIGFIYPYTKRKPMDDPRVTRALRLLIDHDEFITGYAESQYGRGGYGAMFPTALSDWDLTADEYKQHLEWKQPKDEAAKEAIALLTAAGFTKENPLKFPFTARDVQYTAASAQLTQAQWKRLSQEIVDVDLKLLDQNALDATRAQRTFTYGNFGHSAGMVDPDVWLSSSYRSGGSLNFMDFSDPTLDAMIDKQRTLFDETQRKAAVKQIILYYIDHGPSTIPVNLYLLDGVRPKVHGHVPENFLNGRQYQSVWIDA